MSKHNAETYQRETCSQKRYQDLGRATGRCQFCPLPAAPNRTLCEKHLMENRQRSKVLTARAAARGDCVTCRKVPVPSGRKVCTACLEKAKARAARLQEAGICRECSVRPLVPGRTRCAECAERTRHRVLFSPKSKDSLDGMRQITLDRDNHQCRLCGSDARVLIHHIDGNGVSKSGRAHPANNSPNNLVTLCRSCHGWLEGLLRTCSDRELLLRMIERRPLE